VILVLALWFVIRRKRGNELAAIDAFIGRMQGATTLKNKPLDQLLTQQCGFNREQVDTVLQQVSDSERVLFQRIIQMYLLREISMLGEIDQSIGELSDPYCQVIIGMTNDHHEHAPAVGGGGAIAEFERANQLLSRQLKTAMQTIDDVTAEYARVFSGQQSALELENGRKQMLEVFQHAEQEIKQNLKIS
jgi:hypothetical protein